MIRETVKITEVVETWDNVPAPVTAKTKIKPINGMMFSMSLR